MSLRNLARLGLVALFLTGLVAGGVRAQSVVEQNAIIAAATW
jgi:hypothetical protein